LPEKAWWIRGSPLNAMSSRGGGSQLVSIHGICGGVETRFVGPTLTQCLTNESWNLRILETWAHGEEAIPIFQAIFVLLIKMIASDIEMQENVNF
jgi:hypothetical protein